jgi:JmjC domain
LPRDRSWRWITPCFRESRAMAASGLPFQIASDRRYDRSGDPRHLSRALDDGATVFMPQIHQVLPRVTRLMVALRVALLGPLREECSFLFLVDGRGRSGMGLHHDGDVDAFWLQLEGRRTVTLGPPVPRGTPLDIKRRPPTGDPRWVTLDLEPGTLFHLPPRTPHDVVCHARSLALSLTWARPRRGRRPEQARRESLVTWDVASGRVAAMPPRRPGRLWTQVPALAGRTHRTHRAFTLWTPEGGFRLPAAGRPFASRLGLMPAIHSRDANDADTLRVLNRLGILAPHDLPLRIVPDDPRALDGWRFA